MTDDLTPLQARFLEEDRKEQSARGGLTVGMDFNPDEYAKAIRLAASRKVDPSAVLRDMRDFERADKMDMLDGMAVSHPVTTSFLGDPHKAALAHDDLDQMKALEAIITKSKSWRDVPVMSAAPVPSFKEKLETWGRRLVDGTLFMGEDEARDVRQARAALKLAGVQEGGEIVGMTGGQVVGAVGRGIINPLTGLQEYLHAKTGLGGDTLDLLKAAKRGLAPQTQQDANAAMSLLEGVSSTAGLIAPGMGARWGALKLASKVPALAKWAPFIAAGASAAVESASEAGGVYDELKQRGFSHDDAASRADKAFLGNMLLLTATNRIGFFNPKPGAGHLARTMASEGFQEGSQKVISNVATDRPWEQGVLEEAAMGGLSAGILEGAGKVLAKFAGANRGVVGVNRQHSAAMESFLHLEEFMRGQDLLRDLDDTAKNAKLRERSPEAFREFVEQNAPPDVLVPVEAFTSYFQPKGMNPVTVAEWLGIRNYPEAVATGSSLVIPTSQYATLIAGTEHHQALAPHLTFAEDIPSLSEMTASQETDETAQAVEQDAAMAAAEADLAEVQTPLFEAVRNNVRDQLVAAGMEPKTAATNAEVFASRISTVAKRENITTEELLKFIPTVSRPGVTEKPGAPIVDVALGRLAEGQEVTVQEDEEPFQMFNQRPPGTSEPMLFGSKEWNEYYRNAQRGNRAKGDRAERARKGMEGAATKKGQAAQAEAERAAYEAYQAEFRAFDESVKALQVGTVMPSGDEQGFIQFGEDRKFQIGFLKGADLSTFGHETFHLYFEMMGDLAEREGASDQIKADYAALLEHIGAKDRASITTEQHERVARMGEAYLREGKAPSVALRDAFNRFRVWLKEIIYPSLRALNVTLNDDIRGVFDRMFATDEEIAQAKAQLEDPRPLFATAKDAGVSQAEFDLLAKIKAKDIEEAQTNLDHELIQEVNRENEAWWKAEEKQTREDVQKESEVHPVYLAIRALRKGAMVDGTPIALDRAELVKEFGEDRVKALNETHPNLYRHEGGMDAQTVAEILGLGSSVDMVTALEGAPKRKDWVKQEVKTRMLAKHGNMLLDGRIAEKAQEAVHTSSREDRLLIELRILRKLQKEAAPLVKLAKDQAIEGARAAFEAIPDSKEFRAAAANLIGNTPIQRITPHKYILASRKASALAAEAWGKTRAIDRETTDETGRRTLYENYKAAADARQRELLNHYMYLEAVKAKEQAERHFQYGKKSGESSAQSVLGKADALTGSDFQGQLNRILDRFEFERVTNKELLSRRVDRPPQSLAQWIESMGGDDAGFRVDPSILDEGFRKNWKELTPNELQAVRDAIQNIRHLAKEILNPILDGKQFDYEQEVLSTAEEIERNHPSKQVAIGGTDLSAKEKAVNWLKGFVAQHKKLTFIVDLLDQGKIDGGMRRNVKQLIDNAHGREMAIGHEIASQLKAWQDSQPLEMRRARKESIGVKPPWADRPLNRLQAMSFLAYMGTLENRHVLFGGYNLVDQNGNLDPIVGEIVSKLHTEEIRAVQDLWNILEGLWPNLAAHEKRISGLEPKKKSLTPFKVTSAEGVQVELLGGYMPLVADPAAPNAVAAKQISGDLSKVFESGYRAATSHSFTKGVTGATYPLLLDFEQTVSQHAAAYAKDLSSREAVMYVNRFINNPSIKKAIQEAIGSDYYKEFQPWLQAYANDRNPDPTMGGATLKALNYFKMGTAVARIGGNFASAAIQLSDVGKSFFQLDARYVLESMAQLARHPKETVEWIKTLSPNEMLYRSENFDREYRQFLESKSMLAEKNERAKEFSFTFLRVMDRYNSAIAWNAGFKQAMAEHGDKAKAVQEADRAVQMVSQAGQTKEMARLFREKGWTQLFTTFQSDANTWFNLISGTVDRKQYYKLSKGLMFLIASQVLGKLLVGRGPDDDDELALWIAKEAVLSSTADLVPIWGNPVRAAAERAMGKRATMNVAPVFSTADRALDAFSSTQKAVMGEGEWEKAIADDVEVAGLMLGVPGTSQAVRTWKYVHRVSTGEEKPKNVGDFTYHAVFGKAKAK